MVLNAEMKLRASLMRTKSRGSHYRDDYPKRNDSDWLAWIKIRQNDKGRMKLVKHPVQGIGSWSSFILQAGLRRDMRELEGVEGSWLLRSFLKPQRT